jgi:hypothetical protein
MLMRSMGLRSEKGCVGDAQQKLKTTDPTSHQRERSMPTNSQLSKKIKERRRKNLSWVPVGCLTPRQAGRLTVGHNITLTLVLEGYILRKLQHGLNVMAEWPKRWNIKINEDKMQAIYFSHRIRPPESLLTLNGRNTPFVNNVKYLGVIFDKKITLRLHIKTIDAKAFRALIRTYFLFKSERLSDNINL